MSFLLKKYKKQHSHKTDEEPQQNGTKFCPEKNGNIKSNLEPNTERLSTDSAHNETNDELTTRNRWRSLESLGEALECLGDTQPIVARSIPRGAPPHQPPTCSKANSAVNSQSANLQNGTSDSTRPSGQRVVNGDSAKVNAQCLYSQQVYDAMLDESMDTMAKLQHNLDSLIDQVRWQGANCQPPATAAACDL